MTSDTIFALWPIVPFGAEENNESGNSGTDNSGSSGEQSNSQGNQGNSGQGNQGGSEDGEDDPYKGLSTRELKRLLADAEEKGTTVSQELKTLQDKQAEEERSKLSKDEQKDRRIADLEGENSTLRTALAKQSIINAITANKTYEWNNAEIVAQQLDSEKVKVDDKGKVTGLDRELTRIANDKSLEFLLVNKNSDNNQNNNQQQQQQQQNNGVTGFQPGQGGAGSGNGIPENAQELAKLMPALSSRLV